MILRGKQVYISKMYCYTIDFFDNICYNIHKKIVKSQ